MSSDETVTDIAAEMRRLAGNLHSRARNIPTLSIRTWLGLADRIEAAAARDRESATKAALAARCRDCGIADLSAGVVNLLKTVEDFVGWALAVAGCDGRSCSRCESAAKCMFIMSLNSVREAMRTVAETNQKQETQWKS
jgi:hypothetical protein